MTSVSAQAGVHGTGKSAYHPALPSPLQLDGRRLAILCQKVENLVVGAPCGIMDQVSSGGRATAWCG